jgi:hypothetical protein
MVVQPGSPVPGSTPLFNPEPETVEALLATTVRVVTDERSRGQAADTKAGQLVGFIGVILAIDASLGGDVFDNGITGAYGDIFACLFVISLFVLVAAAYVAIRGLLRPQGTLAFRSSEVKQLADNPLVQAEAVEIKRTLIRTYCDALVAEEETNNRKLDVVNRAGLLLTIGVFALAAGGGTLAVEYLAMGTLKQPQASPILKTRLSVLTITAMRHRSSDHYKRVLRK